MTVAVAIVGRMPYSWRTRNAPMGGLLHMMTRVTIAGLVVLVLLGVGAPAPAHSWPGLCARTAALRAEMSRRDAENSVL